MNKCFANWLLIYFYKVHQKIYKKVNVWVNATERVNGLFEV